jgi:hypothetical protein
MKSVYSAVRTGPLNKAVCASSLKGYLRTNSDLCHLQHKLIGFYKRDEMCLQRGTHWVFKYSSLRFVFKGLKSELIQFLCIYKSNLPLMVKTLRTSRTDKQFNVTVAMLERT